MRKGLAIYAENLPMKGLEGLSPNQIYKNPKIEIKQRNEKELAKDQIRLKMIYIGICGSDLHMIKRNPKNGYISTTAPLSIPSDGRIIGHEGLGVVLEVGTSVTNIKEGMYVTLESIIACGTCHVCKRGDYNQCRNAQLLGLQVDGVMGDIVDVHYTLAHDVTGYIDSEDDFLDMACVEPASVAYVACENAKFRGGEKVTIFGAGPIGIYIAMLAKKVFGASQITVIEPSKLRRDIVKRWADFTYVDVKQLETEEYFTDFVFETSGNLDNINRIFRNIDANGSAILLARSGEKMMINDVDHMISNNIRIVGSRGHLGGAFRRILDLNKSKQIELGSIVTSTVDGLEGAKKIMNDINIVEKECKVLVKM